MLVEAQLPCFLLELADHLHKVNEEVAEGLNRGCVFLRNALGGDLFFLRHVQLLRSGPKLRVKDGWGDVCGFASGEVDVALHLPFLALPASLVWDLVRIFHGRVHAVPSAAHAVVACHQGCDGTVWKGANGGLLFLLSLGWFGALVLLPRCGLLERRSLVVVVVGGRLGLLFSLLGVSVTGLHNAL